MSGPVIEIAADGVDEEQQHERDHRAAVSDGIYDGELMEIARELTLHVKPQATTPVFDLEPDAERTLLLDQYDTIRYSVHGTDGKWIAGDTELTPRAKSHTDDFYDGELHAEHVRIVELRRVDGTSPSVVVQVAETRVKRRRLAKKSSSVSSCRSSS